MVYFSLFPADMSFNFYLPPLFWAFYFSVCWSRKRSINRKLKFAYMFSTGPKLKYFKTFCEDKTSKDNPDQQTQEIKMNNVFQFQLGNIF